MTRTYRLAEAQRQFSQNIAAISADFHTHRRYWEFYETFGKLIDGFIGNYDLCVEMAESLTDWELENGGLMAYEDNGVPWIESSKTMSRICLSGPLRPAAGSIPAPFCAKFRFFRFPQSRRRPRCGWQAVNPQ